MKTGDVVLDGQGRSYQVGPLLGRGLWGKSYLVRHGDSRAEYVLKCPLSREDFKGDVPLTDELLDACRRACAEQGALIGQGNWVFLPPLQGQGAEQGPPMVILPRFTTTLDQRIAQGCPLTEVLDTLLQTLNHLRVLADDHGPHGNLRPSNILLNDRGQVLLSDLATPSYKRTAGRLNAVSPDPNLYLPPDVLRASGDAPLTQGTDTYAIGVMLYRAVMTPRQGELDGPVDLPTGGLDKATLLELKEKAAERLQGEDANPRFHARLAERLATLLNRAISAESHPSPPFRFARVAEMLPRVEELRALIRPDIQNVGRVMLDRPPSSSTFETDEVVAWSITVAPTIGVDSPEEIACGIAIFDEETDERIRDVECQYTADQHPSGRYRFAFKLLGLAPGRYRTRVAFAIRDSGHPPRTAETTFEVRAAAGYVPNSEPTPQALSFEPRDDEPQTAVTEIKPPAAPKADREPAMPVPIAPARNTTKARPAPVAKLPTNPPDLPAAPSQPTPAPAVSAPVVPTPSPPPEPPRVVAPASPAPIAPTVRPPTPVTPPPRPAVPEDTLSDLLEPAQSTMAGALEPPPTTPSQPAPVPADPFAEMSGNDWSQVPLPGSAADPVLGSRPDLDDDPDPYAIGPFARLMEMVRGDAYILYMGGAIVCIVILILILILVG